MVLLVVVFSSVCSNGHSFFVLPKLLDMIWLVLCNDTVNKLNAFNSANNFRCFTTSYPVLEWKLRDRMNLSKKTQRQVFSHHGQINVLFFFGIICIFALSVCWEHFLPFKVGKYLTDLEQAGSFHQLFSCSDVCSFSLTCVSS